MWIARDRKGQLRLFIEKPVLYNGAVWRPQPTSIAYLGPTFSNGYTFDALDARLYPELTFENSPKELIVEP